MKHDLVSKFERWKGRHFAALRHWGVFWVNPLEFDMLQKFITCAKKINRCRISFAC